MNGVTKSQTKVQIKQVGRENAWCNALVKTRAKRKIFQSVRERDVVEGLIKITY